MRRLSVLAVMLALLAAAENPSCAEFKRFNVYTDKSARDNHYVPSGWKGDYSDLRLDEGWKENPHSGVTCIRISYTAERKQDAGWAGIYWQNPANNWGTKPGGFNLCGAKKLVFWARGGKGGEKLAEVKIGGITGEYADTDSAPAGPITLTPEWKEYTIDLRGKELSYISGGFWWSVNVTDNPKGFTVYLDDIYYE